MNLPWLSDVCEELLKGKHEFNFICFSDIDS
jgi:hypothetical protein